MMWRTLWAGFRLRCPNCKQGHISRGIFSVQQQCEVCGVYFERKSGESAGASIIWISILPFLALMLFFVLHRLWPDASLVILLGVPVGLLLIVGAVFYRNVRGLWIAIVHLTDGLKGDNPQV
ncbi:DUF983 domain-containing protein [Phototrophicus methaneseepsis]|uniref:DUF983 domain-containing protein n=1 Tax=Phototrophicus methaneseepsis TaxID=2710758 RepID=A0A7S8IEX8_9CHLR|nr:DUF983 domain-containing protein [Phototrophicus methaneseepsis]QPC82318.1 DUF983 domain-containing protein [Phototrophicus methaneseepsis]